jgi:hypothetical protein
LDLDGSFVEEDRGYCPDEVLYEGYEEGSQEDDKGGCV